ncbi:MAG TPA: Ig domain-containing protein [Gaiellaceae bacterium]|nr:Ig domain-containing protein [Gaiellaceae bacterium]
MAATAGALAFDDQRPCPAAYTENESGEPLPPAPFVCPEGIVGTPYAIQLIGRGSCEPYFRFTVLSGALPPGISFSSGGLLSGTPARAGSWRFRVRAQDLRAPDGGPEWCISADQADGEFVITVHPGVVVTTEAAAPGTVGAPYALALSAQTTSGPSQLSLVPGCAPAELASGSCPLAWSIVQGQLPAGLRLNPATGQIWGTPTAEGAFSFVVRAALDDGRADTRSLTIVVRQPLAIDARAPFAARGASTLWEVGVPFAARLVAAGGTSTYSWSLAGGALPPGLDVAADGTVAGTPRAAGPFRATIQLEDGEGRTAAFPAVFRVAARLSISTAALRPGKVGRVYRAKLAATGGLVPRRWRAVSGSLPRGIRLDRSRGLVSGTPTRAGRYRVTFEASDRLGVTSTRSLVIDVRA